LWQINVGNKGTVHFYSLAEKEVKYYRFFSIQKALDEFFTQIIIEHTYRID